MYKEKILNHILDYLKLRNIRHSKSGKIVMVKCPFCNSEPISANIIPNTNIVNCFICKKKYNLIDITKQIDNLDDKNEEDILQHLKILLKIDVTTKKEEQELESLLDFYVEQGFSLTPVAKNDKAAIESDWVNKEHKNKVEWLNWINNGLNVGLNCGLISKVIVIDFDDLIMYEELKKLNLINETLKQKTTKGWHYIYKYDPDLPKTRIKQYAIDIETDGGQVVIAPSIVNGIGREIIKSNIEEMSMKFKEWLLNNTTNKVEEHSDKILTDIESETYTCPLIGKGQGRNDLFIRMAGKLRYHFSKEQVRKILYIWDKTISNPPLGKEIDQTIMKSVDKYKKIDEKKLEKDIISYLKETEDASKSEIEMAVLGERAKNEKRREIDKTLNDLKNDRVINMKGKGRYYIIKQMDWKDTLIDLSKPIDFKVPYFHDYADFNIGNMIVIGSQNKYGKTGVSINIIKRLINQGVKPYYIYNEKNNGFDKYALALGLKDGDFYHARCVNPNDLIMKENSVTIYDWVRPPKDEGFARTDIIFDNLVQKTEDTNSFLICFVQLKPDNTFFAPAQIGQFPALLCRYLYESDDGKFTKFSVDLIRGDRYHLKKVEIPCVYLSDTKEVKLVSEIEKKEIK